MSLQTLPSSNKRTYEHLVYRYAFCGSVLICGASGFWFLCASDGFSVALLVFIPCSLFSTFTAFNAMMFPWRYSVFGPERKTPRATGQPVIALQTPVTRIGSCGWPLVTWAFFHDGMAISTGIGDAWIPFTLVRRIKRRGKWIVIIHDSKEIRSPIEFSTTIFATEWPDPVYSFLEESMCVEVAEFAMPAAELARRDGLPADDRSKGRLFKTMCLVYRIVRVVFVLALAGFGVYGAAIKYQRQELLEAGFLTIFAVGCVVIAGLTVWWGIPGHEWRRTDDE